MPDHPEPRFLLRAELTFRRCLSPANLNLRNQRLPQSRCVLKETVTTTPILRIDYQYLFLAAVFRKKSLTTTLMIPASL